MLLTNHIHQGEKFTEIVPVGPPIVIPKILPQIIEQHFFLLLLLNFGTQTNV